MKKLWQLFLTFFKLGAFTFGGGYAMISLIEDEIVSKKGWITQEEMMDIITIAESTPGPLAVNMATFVGTKVKGFWGALVATLGLIIPPFVIIICITLLLNEFKSVALVAYALKGIQAGVVVLIFNAFLKFFKGMDKSIISFIFLIVAFFVALLTDFSVVLLILIGGVVGVSISLISSFIAKKKMTQSVANTENSDTSNMVIESNKQDNDVNLSQDNDASTQDNVDKNQGAMSIVDDDKVATCDSPNIDDCTIDNADTISNVSCDKQNDIMNDTSSSQNEDVKDKDCEEHTDSFDGENGGVR